MTRGVPKEIKDGETRVPPKGACSAVRTRRSRGPDDGLPLLKPMSQIAGRLSIQIGAYFLQSQNGGSGVLLGSIPGTMPGRVTIIGAGNSGANACRMAAGMGAHVTILDLNTRKLEGHTSTIGLTQATEPYVVLLAEKGIRRALAEHRGLARGVNTRDGGIVNSAKALGYTGGPGI